MRSKKITEKEKHELARKCQEIRKDVLVIAHKSGSSHVGPALSCVEILVALYSHVMNVGNKRSLDEKRDRFILSKGHGAMSLYACLCQAGFFDRKKLYSYCENGSDLAEHPLANKLDCVEFATGSLGHGLALGIGSAIASRLKKTLYNVYVLMGDGECNEGSVWEAAGLASSLRLNNLIAIIDFNKLQATDSYHKLSGGYDLKNAWQSFGWKTYEVDGHDILAVINCFDEEFFREEKPKVILAHTVKGKGVSFMENELEWHYRPPNSEELKNAIEGLSVDGFKGIKQQ
jgi:transketolase